MTIKTKYRNTCLPADGKRYVRKDSLGGGYFWCETGSRGGWRYDVAQGTCDAEDLPLEVKEKADALRGYQPGYVEWPL